MIEIFGPNTRQVLTFLGQLPELSPEDIDQVTRAWRRTHSRDRAEAWVQMHRGTIEQERYRTMVAASTARQVALSAATTLHRTDWAFWAAASDAAAAIAAGHRMGSHYDILISPLAAVMPSLARSPANAQGGGNIPDSLPEQGSALSEPA